jgi:RNA polymerase sigma-70 factor, ECF subfamily
MSMLAMKFDMNSIFPHLESENGEVCSGPLGLSGGAEREHQAHKGAMIELFRELRGPLYSYLICSGVRPHEAEDVIQETFLRLHEQLCQGARITGVRPWLFRVAHNLSVSFHRAGRRLVHPEQEANEKPNAWIGQADKRPNPEDLFLQKESLQRLEKGLASLTQQQSQCVLLRGEGLKYREIASIMGIGVSSVSELIQRAVVRLSEVIHE